MNQEAGFVPENRSIESLFFGSQEKYIIPRYQRPYTRGKDQANDFWIDLNTDEGQPNFIGSIVLDYGKKNQTGLIEIIDGQQRIMTITIFMATIRDIAKLFDDEIYSYVTQSQCISYVTHRGTSDGEYRITSGDGIRSFFEKYIQSGENNILEYDGRKDKDFKKLTKEQKLVKNNYEYFYAEIMSHIKEMNKEEKIDFLKDLRDKIGGTGSICIKVYSDYDAYTIFETMNARGVDLSAADLLKNLLFSFLKNNGDGVDSAKEKRDIIEDNIISTDSEMKRFLRACWLSSRGHTTMKELYKKFKNEIQTEERAKEYLDEVAECSKIYNLLIKGSKQDWINRFADEGRWMYMHMDGIRKMKVSSCYPVFLCVLRNYEKLCSLRINLGRLFDAIEKFSFGYFTICNQPGNKIEKLYTQLAVKIQREIDMETSSPDKIDSAIDSLIKDLKNNYPSEETFKGSLKELEYEQGYVDIIKYMFYRLDLFLQSGKNRSIQKDIGYYPQDFSREAITIEHIIPQEPSKRGLKASDIKGYVNLTGNLTLLPPSPNKKAGNEVLREKVKSYSQSNFLITRDLVQKLIGNNYEWTGEDVFTRTNELADQIWNIFKF